MAPSFLITCNRLCVPNLTTDLFKRTLKTGEFAGFLFKLEGLLEDNAVLTKGGKLSNLHGYGTEHPVWVAIDELAYQRTMLNTADSVCILNNGGVGTLNFGTQLPFLLAALQPDIIIAPTDHYPWKDSRLKRIRKSTERTQSYSELTLRACVGLETKVCPAISLHLANGEEEEKSKLVELEMQKRVGSINGAPLASIHIEQDYLYSAQAQSALYRGMVTPAEVISLTLRGFTIFESSYATHAAEQGKAILIDDDGLETIFDLSDPLYFDDFSPLSVNCACVACSGADKTSKSYIHHLIMSREMLSSVFLSSHNLAQFARLFYKD